MRLPDSRAVAKWVQFANNIRAHWAGRQSRYMAGSWGYSGAKVAKSRHLRLVDHTLLDRIFAELDELHAAPIEGRFQHLVDSLGRALGRIHTGVWFRRVPMDLSEVPGPMLFFRQSGLTESQRADFHALFISNPELRVDPLLAAVRPSLRPNRTFVYTRPEIVDDAEWYGSAYVEGFRRPVGFDHTLTAAVRTTGDLVRGVGCWHEWGARDFDERERRFLRAMLSRLGWLAHQLRDVAAAIPPLSPRERDVLELLLRGLSEKQIAGELGIGPRTVHEYVTSLYRKFGVRSIRELMAHWIRQ